MNDGEALTISDLARRLHIPRYAVYGVLVAYGIRPKPGIGLKRRWGRVVTREQFERIVRRYVQAIKELRAAK
jgi:hypothetical protein